MRANQRVFTSIALTVLMGNGCGHGAPEGVLAPGENWLWTTSFDTASELTSWNVDLSTDTAGIVRHEASVEMRGIVFEITSLEGSVKLKRRLEADVLRNQRIRLTARMRTRRTLVRAALQVGRSNAKEGIADLAESSDIVEGKWIDAHAVADVSHDATYIDIELNARGKGEVWIDYVRVERLGPRNQSTVGPTSLSRERQEALAALGRVLSLVRYFHPSDENAHTDWDLFSIHAVDRLLASSNEPLRDVINDILRPIAPITNVYDEGDPPTIQSPSPSGAPKTWWHHYGLGGPHPVYCSLRIGAGEPTTAGVVYVPVPSHLVDGCRRATVSLKPEMLDGDMDAQLEMRLVQSGDRESNPREPIRTVGAVARLAHDLPSDLVSVEVGLRGSGMGLVAAASLTFQCDGHQPVVLDPKTVIDRNVYSPVKSLYAKGVRQCSSGHCVYVQRRAPEPASEWLDVAIGGGLRLRMPLVLDYRGGRTWPAPVSRRAPATPIWSVSDRATRLAAVLMTWGTLAHFYPYFPEVNVDWSRELAPALEAASRARSPDETLAVLARLVSRLDDGHARVSHPGVRLTGHGPLALNWMEGSLIVAGGLDSYLSLAPVGSEVLSLDGVPANAAYARMSGELSSATEGFRKFIVPWFLNVGPIGTLRRLEVRLAGGGVREVVVPMLDRNEMRHRAREPKPRAGTQLSSGIFFVDLDALEEGTWQQLLGDLSKARAIIFDMRGYPSESAFAVISHLIDKEIASSFFDVPLVGATGVTGYDRIQWTMRPRAPRLRAKAIFLIDGRAASAAESLLQLVRDHSLGVLVGEPTAGTNGNIASFIVPGGFVVRFTGMRVTSLGGGLIHGRGIEPDYVAHPTLGGVRRGHDEVLEEAVRVSLGHALPRKTEGSR